LTTIPIEEKRHIKPIRTKPAKVQGKDAAVVDSIPPHAIQDRSRGARKVLDLLLVERVRVCGKDRKIPRDQIGERIGPVPVIEFVEP